MKYKQYIKEIPRLIEIISDYVLKWIWQDTKDETFWIRAGKLLSRFVLILVNDVIKNRLTVHASALTYMTLLSILPLVAVILAIAKGVGFLEVSAIRQAITERVPELADSLTTVFNHMEASDFSSFGIAGVIFLVSAIISGMTKIEKAFNDIWSVKKSRHYWKKILPYSGLLIAALLTFVFASAFQFFSAKLLLKMLPQLGGEPLMNVALSNLFTFLSLAMGFSLLIKVMPNTHVPWIPCLISGAIAAPLYMFVSWAFFDLQVGMANYNLVYSSLAAIPITIIWINLSWLIMLMIGEITYIVIYFNAFRPETMDEVISPEFVEETALKIAIYMAKRHENESTIPPAELANALKLPPHFALEILSTLKDGKFLRETKDGISLYNDKILTKRLYDIIQVVRKANGHKAKDNRNSFDKLVYGYLKETGDKLSSSPKNITLEETRI